MWPVVAADEDLFELGKKTILKWWAKRASETKASENKKIRHLEG
jgi:hypothetical protein